MLFCIILKKILSFLFLLITCSKETFIAHFNNMTFITIIVFVKNFVVILLSLVDTIVLIKSDLGQMRSIIF
jgi:hypothetical protein